MNLPYKTLRDGVQEPTYAHEGDAGMDLRTTESCTLRPLERKLLHSGISMQIPEGYFGAVVPRSGLALKRGISLVNTPGIVDSTYRGEIGMCVVNLSTETVTIEKGERVAQIVFQPYAKMDLVKTVSLDDTERGAGGFGSTGTK